MYGSLIFNSSVCEFVHEYFKYSNAPSHTIASIEQNENKVCTPQHTSQGRQHKRASILVYAHGKASINQSIGADMRRHVACVESICGNAFFFFLNGMRFMWRNATIQRIDTIAIDVISKINTKKSSKMLCFFSFARKID